MLNAASSTSAISQDEIRSRNAIVDKRISSNNLRAVNVVGDGNCFFRSLFVCLSGGESDHNKLRKAISQYMIDSNAHLLADSSSLAAKKALYHLQSMGKDGVEVGEDVICAAASYLGRPVHVYSSLGHTWPCEYLPGGVTVLAPKPVRLAFYEPGHYMAVLGVAHCDDHTSPLASPSLVNYNTPVGNQLH